MLKPKNSLARLRPIISSSDTLSNRISAAGLLYLKNFMAERTHFFSKRSTQSVHQMRVALRKLRTVLRIISEISSDAEILQHDEHLKRFMSVLGSGRDQDIFIEMMQRIPPSFQHDLNFQGFGVDAILAIRDRHYKQIDITLQDPSYIVFFAKLVDMFQSGRFIVSKAELDNENLDAHILNIFHSRTLKRGRKLANLDLHERHRLRIALKKLRYALEFMCLTHKNSVEAKSFRKSIEKLLDQLGSANDAYTASRIAGESLIETDPKIHMMAGMIAGWHGCAVQHAERQLIKTWQTYKSLEPYWTSKAKS